MNSRLATGWVRHRHRSPVRHEFRQRLFMTLLDLAELDAVFAGRLLWSCTRPAPLWFRRADHLGDPALPLDVAVRDLVQERLGFRPDGPVRLLTNLRVLGLAFNPVSFHLCLDRAGERLLALVAEITNTPWLERHAYVLDAREQRGAVYRWRFPKAFHVSPFLPMDLEYDWRVSLAPGAVVIHMDDLRDGEPVFDATLRLSLEPLGGRRLAATLLRHPWMTAQVVAGIYWQALRLWRKGAPFFPHPGAARRRARAAPAPPAGGRARPSATSARRS